MKKCPICGFEMQEIQTLFGKLNTANVVNNYSDKVNRADLIIYKCPVCNHGAINNYLDDEFYTDFSVALGGDADNEAAINQRSKQFEPIIDFMVDKSPNVDSILEIGSGCGYLLKAAKKKYLKVLGVEPSKTEYDISVKVAPDVKIVNDFFSPKLGLKEQFSAFIATMVFEHIPDVTVAMEYAYNLLIDNGIGFITVPNGQRSFFGGCYYDIYPQHLHYFSIVSLSKLALNAGFEITFVRESENKDYLEMLVKKTETRYLDNFTTRLDFDKEKLRDIVSRYKAVSIWGASYLARSCVEFFPPESIKHFYDVSSVKVGKYIADFPLQIECPTRESVNENDLIIIMANEYTADVLKTLNYFGYNGTILGFDSNGYITELSANTKLRK